MIYDVRNNCTKTKKEKIDGKVLMAVALHKWSFPDYYFFPGKSHSTVSV